MLHFLEVLRDRIGFDELKKKVVNPLTGKKIGAYYGCLLLRPGKIMAFDNPENPTIIEDSSVPSVLNRLCIHTGTNAAEDTFL